MKGIHSKKNKMYSTKHLQREAWSKGEGGGGPDPLDPLRGVQQLIVIVFKDPTYHVRYN